MSLSPTEPVPVGPAAIRPRPWLYGLAAAIAVAAIALSVISFVVSAARAPNLQEIGVGVQTMTLRAADPKWLYVSQPERIVPPPCQLLGTGDVTIEPLARLVSVESDGSTWYALARISVSQDGQYGLACSGAPGDVRLALGSEPRGAGLFGSFVLKFLVPIGGLVAAVVLFLVTLIRRRSHRAGLAAAGAGSTWSPPLPPGPGQGPGAPPGYQNPPGYPGQGYDQQGYGNQGWPGQPGQPGQQDQPPTQFWQG